MENSTFSLILDRHFKMNEDYTLDLIYDLLEEEQKLEAITNYFELVQENEITPRMRTKLVEWMIQLADEMKLGFKTKQTAIIIVDLILSKKKIHKNFLQLLGITAICIAIKSEESFIYTLKNACEHCNNVYTAQQVSDMEEMILTTLKWKLQYPTAGEIARRLVQLSNHILNMNLVKFYKKIDNFIDLAVSDYDVGTFSPITVAVAAVMCAFENSLPHVKTWRSLMMENFNLDFENKIDVLYEYIVQKLRKFYPDYFNFPVGEVEEQSQETQGGSAIAEEQKIEMEIQNNENNGMGMGMEMGMGLGLKAIQEETEIGDMSTNDMSFGHQNMNMMEMGSQGGQFGVLGGINNCMEEEIY